MASRVVLAALMVVFLVTAQAMRPVPNAALAVATDLVEATHTLPMAASRQLLQSKNVAQKPKGAKAAKGADTASSAFGRLEKGQKD